MKVKILDECTSSTWLKFFCSLELSLWLVLVMTSVDKQSTTVNSSNSRLRPKTAGSCRGKIKGLFRE